MHRIKCELNYLEWELLIDILGHVNIDEEEMNVYNSLRKKLDM